MGLTAFKLVVGVLSGSVGVLSEAIHSFLDLISAAVSFFTVRLAVKPADEDHPFGHGKIETLSSLFEALLLVLAAVLIIHEGIDHIRHPQPVAYQGLAMVTIFISMVVSWFTYRHNLAAAKHTDSSALHVNALHFLSDVVASAGVLGGLILLKVTGWMLVDPLMAFAVAGYILLISAGQVKHALFELTDRQLPQVEVETIRTILSGFTGQVIDAHDLRTRKSGVTRHIDFHLSLCGSMSVSDSHSICDRMEEKIQGTFPTASVNIHVEPCAMKSADCQTACAHFREIGRISRDRKKERRT